MRAKILEGMAVGKVVLSTRLGIEGIEATDRQEYLMAEQPDEWLEALRWCYAEREKLADMGTRARTFCEQHFDNLQVAGKLLEQLSALRSAPRSTQYAP